MTIDLEYFGSIADKYGWAHEIFVSKIDNYIEIFTTGNSLDGGYNKPLYIGKIYNMKSIKPEIFIDFIKKCLL